MVELLATKEVKFLCLFNSKLFDYILFKVVMFWSNSMIDLLITKVVKSLCLINFKCYDFCSFTYNFDALNDMKIIG